jgi:hypothetical protein
VVALQHRPASRLSGLQATCSGGLRAHPCRLAGCATPTRSAGQAPGGATISTELTSTPDHSGGQVNETAGVKGRDGVPGAFPPGSTEPSDETKNARAIMAARSRS